MIVRRAGGLTEFIPSPQEKRDGVLRDHALDLLANLEARVRRIEKRLGIPPEAATEFANLMAAIRREEHEAGRINQELLDAGLTHQERAT
ncbi:MAG TPA: VrlD [bacterium]|nr:VrlD [bacterium]